VRKSKSFLTKNSLKIAGTIHFMLRRRFVVSQIWKTACAAFQRIFFIKLKGTSQEEEKFPDKLSLEQLGD
jgi:hypothetical protein